MRRGTRFSGIVRAPGAFTALARRMKAGVRDEDGQEVVEFAIVSILLCLFIFGVMEMCLVFFFQDSVAEAAREASRWASVRGVNSATAGVCNNPNITTCPATAAEIQSYAQGLTGLSGASVSVSWCTPTGTCSTSESNATPGNIVEVTVSDQFASIPLVPQLALNLSSTSEMVIWE